MKTLPCLVGSVVIFILASCGGKSETSQGEPAADSSDAKVPATYLEGMYATSTRLPLHQYTPYNVFDGDTTTYWSTAVGAASDEGIMLYFPANTYVKEIRLVPAAGSDLASIKTVSVYGDGHKIVTADVASNIPIDETIASLFIRIEQTDHSDVVNVSDGDGEQSLERFDSKLSVGLSEIRIFDNASRLEVIPPVSLAGSVTASSVLSPADAYAAAQLFDSRKEFVWAEGGKGSGENETLTFNLQDDQTISTIKIWNGYQRSDKHFFANARIKSFEFGTTGGNKVRYTIDDSMEPQEVKLDGPLSGKDFLLTVLEVYPGKDYKDLVVSELIFFNDNMPFVISNSQSEKVVKDVITRTKGSVLEAYIDKRLKNHSDYADYVSDKSLILRSNKTFVVYEHTSSSDGSKEENRETVADGNWEIIEQLDNYAKIRIFGKLFDVSEAVEAYKGNTTSEVIKIFQDNLHITPEEVKGEKYIDAFFNRL
jgi:hypothetical protein